MAVTVGVTVLLDTLSQALSSGCTEITGILKYSEFVDSVRTGSVSDTGATDTGVPDTGIMDTGSVTYTGVLGTEGAICIGCVMDTGCAIDTSTGVLGTGKVTGTGCEDGIAGLSSGGGGIAGWGMEVFDFAGGETGSDLILTCFERSTLSTIQSSGSSMYT